MGNEAKACLIAGLIGILSILSRIDGISWAILYFVVLIYYDQRDISR